MKLLLLVSEEMCSSHRAQNRQTFCNSESFTTFQPAAVITVQSSVTDVICACGCPLSVCVLLEGGGACLDKYETMRMDPAGCAGPFQYVIWGQAGRACAGKGWGRSLVNGLCVEWVASHSQVNVGFGLRGKAAANKVI